MMLRSVPKLLKVKPQSSSSVYSYATRGSHSLISNKPVAGSISSFGPLFARTYKNSRVLRNEETSTEKPQEATVNIKETTTGNAVKHEFQTETRKLLDIVAHSLYSDREVFVRELISNASDALEKARHLQLAGTPIIDNDLPFEIDISTDANKRILVIQDTGIGMNDEELVRNLGNIGHSGSLEFIKSMQEKGNSTDIIGQFGVGFYSVFMVAKKVTVYSRSAKEGSKGYCWTSDGLGSYEISEAEGVSRGTKIVIELNEKSIEFSAPSAIERIIKTYSNFVGFSIKLNGVQVNTIKALWTLNKNQISQEEHKEFYQFISRAYDEPMYNLHYSTDSPINIRSLFYIPSKHTEKMGLSRMEAGINLFSKKVLIQSKAELLPDYLRFLRGVVDSEDLPLNLSREHLQDSALIRRLGSVLTKRIIKWLDDESKRDSIKYEKFFEEFGNFIREGVCSDLTNKEELAKLMRIESSAVPQGKYTSFDEYIERVGADQTSILYFCAPSRILAEDSPYYEAFKAKNKEVLFLYSPLDDFVMKALGKYKGKNLISVESQEASQALSQGEEEKKSEDDGSRLSADESKNLVDWFKQTLANKVSSVRDTTRLVDSPAIIVDHDTAAFRRMMRYVDSANAPATPKQQLEVNVNHPIVRKLNDIRSSKPELATLVAEQIYDDALLAAGLMDDARVMMPRLNKLLAAALEQSK